MVFVVSLLLVLTLISAGIFQMIWVKRTLNAEFYNAISEMPYSLALKSVLEQSRIQLLTLLLEQDNRNLIQEHQAIKRSTELINHTLGVLLHEDGDKAREIHAQRDALKAIWDQFVLTRDEEIFPALFRGENRAALELVMGKQRKRYETFMALADALVEKTSRTAGNTQAFLEHMLLQTITLYVIVALLGLSLATILVYRFTGNIFARFNTIVSRLEGFKRGEKPACSDPGKIRKDELGNFEHMLEHFLVELYEHRIEHERFLLLLQSEMVENRKKKDALKKSEEKYRALVETTTDWVWEVNADLVYSYASPKVENLLGYKPEEIIGQSPFALMLPEEAARISKDFAEIIDKRLPISNLENRNLHKDGHVVVLESSCTPFYDSRGVFLGYRGIDRNVTARKKAEEEAAAMREQLLQSEKMASVGLLAAGVAHEINNPVGYLSSNLYALAEDISKISAALRGNKASLHAPERGGPYAVKLGETEWIRDMNATLQEMAQIVNECRDGLERIESIVTGLKGFSHREADEAKAYDINQCIEDAIRLSWHEVKYGASLEKALQALPRVWCKPRQITQVLVNMLLNAVQAMEQGHIKIKSWASSDGKEVFISIEDNGPGISKEMQRRIFDPFFTTKPVGQGTGLGLSVAYGIVSEHGGKIQVKSAPGGGAAFVISLPVMNNFASTE